MNDHEQLNNVTWDSDVQKKFEQMSSKIPIFLRDIAQKKVFQKAEDFARKDGRTLVSQKDLVDAFFAETPFGFHGPMKNDMNEFGIDYTKYGYPK
ncbi:MAG: PCP reductase family protein [Candidatus Omnitrophica bacterium]|nr:PCP reductase family protein [Candidatus Omnitrophota bacterium]